MGKKQRRIKLGTCRLTGESGKFIKSHIIPRSLALPRAGGEAFAQFGNRQRPSRRRNSWYDQELVTAAGEDIFTSYDTWAVQELRRLKLIWQSWGPMQRLSPQEHVILPGLACGFRNVEFSDPIRMRMFLLSLLWRAAATSLSEFREIALSKQQMEILGECLRKNDAPELNFFPATMTQISSVGIMHNLSPIAQTKPSMEIFGETIEKEEIFRFYFDGLIVHFYRAPSKKTMAGIKHMMIGQKGKVRIPTLPFEGSWEQENLTISEEESEFEFPGGIERAEGVKRDSHTTEQTTK